MNNNGTSAPEINGVKDIFAFLVASLITGSIVFVPIIILVAIVGSF